MSPGYIQGDGRISLMDTPRRPLTFLETWSAPPEIHKRKSTKEENTHRGGVY